MYSLANSRVWNMFCFKNRFAGLKLNPIRNRAIEIIICRVFLFECRIQIDEDVRMISSEAPLLFAKAAQVFINEVRRKLTAE